MSLSREPGGKPFSRAGGGSWASFAKVNLHLQVVGRRGDGYHELRTLFQTVDLADRIEVELGGTEVRLEVEGAELPAGAGNLAWEAARAYLERWGRRAGIAGVRVRLAKRIPVGGGLGGGSSNAATVLLALQELTGGCAPAPDIWQLSRSLGADVPYFLVGGAALGIGRGDEIVPIPELPPAELVLVLPPFQVATAEVFASLEELTADHLDHRIVALVQSESPTWEALSIAVNDLESVVLRQWPALEEALTTLRDAGASLARVSGSGAALFARFATDPGRGLERRLPEGWRVERVRTLSRAALSRARCIGP